MKSAKNRQASAGAISALKKPGTPAARSKRNQATKKTFTMREINALIAEVRRKNKKPITVHIPKSLLAEIDAQIPNWRYRESFIIGAVRQELMDSQASKTKATKKK